MAQSKLHKLDETLEQANLWLKEINEEWGYPDRQVAYHALRGVLFTLRDRLTVEEAINFSAQLPTLIRGIYFEGYKPANKPVTFRSEDEFLQRVMNELNMVGGADPRDATQAVLTVLSRHVSEGQIRHIYDMLPEEIRNLWPETVS